jgi:hypothetical protein
MKKIFVIHVGYRNNKYDIVSNVLGGDFSYKDVKMYVHPEKLIDESLINTINDNIEYILEIKYVKDEDISKLLIEKFYKDTDIKILSIILCSPSLFYC